jgi:uncharacterized protein YdeI (YjbR/CyaY-like superfamily)
MKPRFFEGPSEFRAWLEEHHGRAAELLVGFYKRGSGKPSMTWPESVDEALCFGWIDGVRRSLGAESYTIRFTPRRARSIWSAVNIGRVAELEKLGRMWPSGRAAFEARAAARSAVYAYEQKKTAALAPAQEKKLRANAKAWRFFQAQAPWYRRTAVHWVVSAKKEETRERRLTTLIDDSAAWRLIGPMKRSASG